MHMPLRTSALMVLLAAAAFAGAPDAEHFRRPLPGVPERKPSTDGASLPELYTPPPQHPASKPADLKPQSRLEIIRYVSGEFAKAVKPLPGGKKGLRFLAGKTLNDKELQTALRTGGVAASPGDTVQITSIEFRSSEIVIQVNGGGKKKYHLKDHLQIGMGGVPASQIPQGPQENSNEGNGSTLILDYGKSIPDMSAEDLMHDLGPFLDFSKERSAAVNWVDTLPPQFKEAIKDRKALEGMDHDMVLAALGRPDHRVREKTPDGEQTEDWIYGTPPAKTTFVTFSGDKVIRVKEFD